MSSTIVREIYLHHGDVKELVPEAVYLALKLVVNEKTLLILTALLALTGCGTVVKLIDPSEKYTPYAGAAYDLEMAQNGAYLF